jgi:hypothetical protein
MARALPHDVLNRVALDQVGAFEGAVQFDYCNKFGFEGIVAPRASF